MSMQLPFLFQRLVDEQVEVVIVGGLAAVALGVPYVTNDVDLCYLSTTDNIAQLARALAPLQPRLRVEGLTDDQARHLPFTLDERTLQQAAILTLQTDVAALDLLRNVPGVGDYRARGLRLSPRRLGFTWPAREQARCRSSKGPTSPASN